MASIGIQAIGAAALAMFVFVADAQAIRWTDWEHRNAVARFRDFLVIRQPEANPAFCYVKQSYDGDQWHMELSAQRGNPFIVTPFFRGISGDVTYWVDEGVVRTVPSADVSANYFPLSPDVIPELKAGNVLYVRVTPGGSRAQKQAFSLRGFTRAYQELDSSDCQ